MDLCQIAGVIPEVIWHDDLGLQNVVSSTVFEIHKSSSIKERATAVEYGAGCVVVFEYVVGCKLASALGSTLASECALMGGTVKCKTAP